MRLRCEKCGLETPEELGFCLNCRASLFRKSSYDLTPSDFAYPPDLGAMRTVNATGPIPYLISKLTRAELENTMISTLLSDAHRVAHPSDLDAIVRRCAVLLSIERLPELFIVEDHRPNAFTFGSEERTYLVLNTALLRDLTRRELVAVVAHELGHVKSGHMIYHTLAEALGHGISLSAALMGLNLLSIPVRFALLSWHRESEVSADRASLLAVEDIGVISSLLHKLSSDSATKPEQPELKYNPSVLETVGELFRTHPMEEKRFKLAQEFWQSEEFRKAKEKIQLRQRVLKALIPICRFCGQSKPTEDLFCVNCGKCQT